MQSASTTDTEIVSPPSDGISSLSFSPTSPSFLCATSWDNNVRIWEIDPHTRNSQPKAQTAHEQPVLCASWSGDGSKIFSGSCDGKANCWDLQTNQSLQVAQHAAPIKSCIWVEESKILATASWDKTLKYWDCRKPNPVITVNLPEKCYYMDIKHPLCCVATADKHVVIYNLNTPQQEYKKLSSPLKHQTRVITCLPNKKGFAIGSIEGRVGIHHVEDKDKSGNYAFRCHRENNSTDLYAVNSIVFRPTHVTTCATTGSDGTFNFWDIENKIRLKSFPKVSQPISCAAFNTLGNIYAYACSYDWSKGADVYNPVTSKNIIYLHTTTDAETKPRPK